MRSPAATMPWLVPPSKTSTQGRAWPSGKASNAPQHSLSLSCDASRNSHCGRAWPANSTVDKAAAPPSPMGLKYNTQTAPPVCRLIAPASPMSVGAVDPARLRAQDVFVLRNRCQECRGDADDEC